MAATLNYPEQNMLNIDQKLIDLPGADKEERSKRKRLTATELMVNRADRMGLQGKDIAARTGRSEAWVSSIVTKKTQKFESLDTFAAALGYEFSFFIALAEDLMAIEDQRNNPAGVRAINEDAESI